MNKMPWEEDYSNPSQKMPWEEDYSKESTPIETKPIETSLEQPKEETSIGSKIGSALGGFSQGGTAGLGDEIYGLANAIGLNQLIQGEPITGTLSERYKEGRDYARNVNKGLEQDNPGSYMAGDIGGGIGLTAGIPMGAAKNAGTLAKIATPILSGAAQGAIQSAGYSEAQAPQDIASDIVKGAELGAILGGTGELLSGGIKKLADWRVLKELGITKRDISKMIYEKGPEETKAFINNILESAQNKFKATTPGEIKTLTKLDNPPKETFKPTGDLIDDTYIKLGLDKKDGIINKIKNKLNETKSYLDKNLISGNNREMLNTVEDLRLRAKDVAFNAPDLESLQAASEKLQMADFIKKKLMEKGVRTSSEFDWLTGATGRGMAGAVLGSSLSEDKFKGGITGGVLGSLYRKGPLVANKVMQSSLRQPITQQAIKAAATTQPEGGSTFERMKQDPEFSQQFQGLSPQQAAVKHNILMKQNENYRKRAMERE